MKRMWINRLENRGLRFGAVGLVLAQFGFLASYLAVSFVELPFRRLFGVIGYASVAIGILIVAIGIVWHWKLILSR
jgi:hypothetical protein